jgi:hypothetical protein
MNEETKLSQLAENMRFFADMRFKQLTLFMAAMTAVAAGIINPNQYRWWIALGGLWITAVIWVMEIRSTINFIKNYNQATELWPRAKSKGCRFVTSSHAVLGLYGGFYATWLLCIKKWGPACCVSFYVGLIVGFALFLFSIANDHDLWKSD